MISVKLLPIGPENEDNSSNVLDTIFLQFLWEKYVNKVG